MHQDILHYLIESGICLAIFYLIYRVFLKNETYFHILRYYLLFALIASSVLPLINIPISEAINNSMPEIQIFPPVLSELPTESNNPDDIDSAPGAFNFTIINYLFFVYIIGVIVFSLKVLTGLIYLAVLIMRTSKTVQYKINIRYHTMNIPPFSFFNSIFIRSGTFNEEEIQQIIEHEKTHSGLLHTIDVLFVESLVAIHWINPFIWLIRNSIKENHDYYIDQYILTKGIQKEKYFELILSLSNGKKILPLTNSIINPDIKNRIKMATTKCKSKPSAMSKLLLVLPVLIFMIYSFSLATIPANEMQEQKIHVPESYNPKLKTGLFIIDSINNFPKNEITIYNKFGEKVVSFKGYNNDWGGRIGENKDSFLPTDIYIYTIKLDDDIPKIKGSVLIFHPDDGLQVSFRKNDKYAIISFPKDRHVIVSHTIPEEDFLFLLDGEKIAVKELQRMSSSEISYDYGVTGAGNYNSNYDLSNIVCVFELRRK